MPEGTDARPIDRFTDLPDVLRFMQLLWAVVHGIEKTSKRMLDTVGVTGPQRLVLRVIGLFPGVSAGGLAAVLHVHPSTLTGVLQRLIARRLLRRDHDPTDRRRAILRLTVGGKRIDGATEGTIEAAVVKTLQGVTVRDRAATQRVLERLRECLEDVGPPGAARARRRSRPKRRTPRST